MNATPQQPAHLVARVVWDSGFDAPSDVRAQQDWLSAFSHTMLPDLLASVFDRCCPPGITWRCDSLEVDLGTILLSRAEQDLPDRLVSELTSALWRRFGSFTAPAAMSASPAGQGFQPRGGQYNPNDGDGSTAATVLALLEHLLLHGSLPWWQKQPAPFLSLWEEALAGQAGELLTMLMRIAQQETVRHRLVWHLGGARLPALIRLAEPTSAEALVDWVNTLIARHVEERLVQDDASGFEHAAWLALLTCLFTQRGSLFNLTDFASAHLRHLAQSYGVAYELLLDRLEQISLRAAPHLPPRFVALIRAILARDAPRRATPTPDMDASSNGEWQLWAQMLSRGQPETTAVQNGETARTIRMQALFTRLAVRDGRRMARSMVAAGPPAGGVLARHLDEKSLRQTVRLLQPSETEFILAHVTHSQYLAQRRHWPRRAVWDVVLTFLLSDQASRFERRQLVETTLRESCRRHGTSFVTALAILIAFAQEAGSDPRQYVLLQILLDLQAELLPATAQAAGSLAADDPQLTADPWSVDPALQMTLAARSKGAPRDYQDIAPVVPLIWKALRWRLRVGRTAPDLPAIVQRMTLAELWQCLPPADLRRWLLAQPDRAHLLPQLAALPTTRRWLSRLVPHALRPVSALLDQALHWFSGAGGPAAPRALLEPVVWHLALDPRAEALAPARFLAQCLLLWCQRLGLGVAACAARGLTAPPSTLWRDAFTTLLGWAEGQGIEPIRLAGADRRKTAAPDAWGQWLETVQGQEHLLRLLCRHSPQALHRRHGVAMLPAMGSPDQRLATAIYQWAWTHPDSFRRLLAKPWQRASVRPRLEARLRTALSLPHLFDLVGRDAAAPAAAHQAIRLINDWQAWQRRLNLPHPARRDDWLWRVVWQAWLYQDWRALEPARLLAAFRQFFLPMSGLNAVRLDERLQSTKPPGAIASLLSALPKPPKPAVLTPTDMPSRHTDGQRLPISNAGLVLLQSYMPALFDRLGLVRDRRFLSPASSHRALLALQFLACGFAQAEEPHLALNKVLCGLNPSAPVPVQADFTDAEVAMMEGMLRAFINHWPEAGASSLDGLRGNWLLREGVLADNADHWGLTVTRRPWDILLSKIPFSYAVIRLPWMAKAVYVTWPC